MFIPEQRNTELPAGPDSNPELLSEPPQSSDRSLN